jgi:hypothetical protein
MEDQEDFNQEEIDPVQRAEMEEIYRAEIEAAMRSAFAYIEEDLGWDAWIANKKIGDRDRKLKILDNMMLWFASPEVEEYEKSARIKRAIATLI